MHNRKICADAIELKRDNRYYFLKQTADKVCNKEMGIKAQHVLPVRSVHEIKCKNLN